MAEKNSSSNYNKNNSNRNVSFDELSLRSPLAAAAAVDHGNLIPISFLFRMYTACQILELSTETRYTSIVLLQRYAVARVVHSMKSNLPSSHFTVNNDDGWSWVGAACIFLACKAEEEPRRLRDVINMTHMVLSSPPSSSPDGRESSTKVVLDVVNKPPTLNEKYWESKKRVIENEQIVLRWIGFDCFVSHPHRAVLLILLQEQSSHESQNRLLPLAFRRLNDGLFAVKALQFDVITLAASAIELATEESTMEQRENNQKIFMEGWWSRYDVNPEHLNDCKSSLIEATSTLEAVVSGSPN
jgi:hypothetical protein